MKCFNPYPLLIVDGEEPQSYSVSTEFISPCQETLIVHAFYKCHSCHSSLKRIFKFYLWKMPTGASGIFDTWLSCFESSLV